MRIYISHCSAKKNDSLRQTLVKVTPDELYTATPLRRFMRKCQQKEVKWAIFSDKYGIWFSDVTNTWYEKNPRKITEEEFEVLKDNFDRRLKSYDEIWFYFNPGRWHSLYRRLLKETKPRSRLRTFTHLKEIR